MPKYTLLADGFSHASLDKKGDITGKTRHIKGDEIKMSESEAQRLVDVGALILSSEVTDDAEGEGGSTEPVTTPEGQGGATDGQDDDTETVPVDYTDEDKFQYADLQGLAKERGLNAGGSRDDLVERLVEYDAAQKS